MRTITTTLFIIFLSFGSYSQDCGAGGITFATQADVDAFYVVYPGCTNIIGNVTIHGNNITNLDGLAQILSIEGNLAIDSNIVLNNINGLSGVKSIGKDLIIKNNNSLLNLSGLSSLLDIGGILQITNNDVLTSLSGLDNLNSSTITNLIIQSSNVLSTCEVPSICNYLAVSTNNATISGNALGCATRAEVINSCTGCPVGNITFNTQGQVDSFPMLYPGCSTIAGNLLIDDGLTGVITKLDSLIQLKTITGKLTIQYNPNLSSLSGLDSLNTVGDSLEINYNSSITNLTGLNSLKSIGGDFNIYLNGNLVNLNGVDSLNNIGGAFRVSYNGNLISLTGINKLNSIGGELNIFNNPSLTNLSGLNSLSSINGNFTLYNNFMLNSIANLSQLTLIAGFIDIEYSSALTSLSGLDNINNTSITNLTILNSNNLSTCNVESICEYLSNPLSPSNIAGNAFGCSSNIEVKMACCNMTATASSTPNLICPGSTSQLVVTNNGGNGNLSYNWEPSVLLNDKSISNPIASPQSTTTFVVTVTDANGCTATSNTTVTLYPEVNPTASSNSPLCESGVITLNAGGGTSYEWSGPLGFVSSLQNPYLYNATQANSGTYSVTVTDANSCTATASTEVSVHPYPSVNPLPTHTYCANTSVPSIVFSSTPPGATFYWSRTPEAIGLGPTSGIGNIPAFTTTNSDTVPLTSTFFVSASIDYNGVICTGVAVQFTVTILPPPLAKCKNKTLYLDAAGAVDVHISDINDFSSGGTLSISNTNFYCANVGQNYVTLTVTDVCGNTSTCSSIVTVIDNKPPVLSNVTSFIQLDCDQAIPGVPNVTATDNCSAVVSFSQTSTKSPFPQLCEYYTYKITRTWIATDPSQNTAVKIQVIKIDDNTPPEWIYLPPKNLTAECNEANVNNSDPIASDACDLSPSVIFTIKYDFGINNCVNNYLATYTWVAGDKCGNTINYIQQISVVDTTAPEIYCPSNIVMNSQVPVKVSWVTPSVTDNCGGAPNVVQIAGPPSGSLFQINSVTTIVYKATDDCHNSSTCSFTVTINTQGGPPKPNISGTLYNNVNTPIKKVSVTLSGSVNQFVVGNGQYNFLSIPFGSNITVTPTKKDNALDGVNTLDLVYISNHILGKKALDSPYKILSADVNNSKNITTADLVQIKRLILHITEKYDAVDSWKFIPKSVSFLNPLNPWLTPYNEFIKINNIQTDQIADFIGIKMGDVTWDASGQINGNIEVKGISDFTLLADNKSFKKKEEVSLVVSAKELKNLKAMQFTLEYNPLFLDFIGIESIRDDVHEDDFGMRFLEDGKITASLDLRDEYGAEELFKVKFSAKETGNLANLISLTSNLTKAEAYTLGDETKALNLSFNKNGIEDKNVTPILYQNEPNPFESGTVIRYYIPENQEASLKIYSSEGKIVKELKESYTKGEHQLNISNEEFPASGIYYYQLKTNNFIDTKKMMFIK